MPRRPRGPMHPSELPQQRLYLVRGKTSPPVSWSPLSGGDLESIQPSTVPRSARYVGQVEWSWSPMHSRITAYFLSMDRRHRLWVLWARFYDGYGRWDRASYAQAAAPRCAADAATAAQLLLEHAWSGEREDGLDHFHWINETGMLDAGEINEIGGAVWGADV